MKVNWRPANFSAGAALLSFLAMAPVACKQPWGTERPAEPTFSAALSNARVEHQEVYLGFVARPSLVPRTLDFASDPLEIQSPTILSGAVGIAPGTDEPVVFSVEARGPLGSVTLAKQVAIEDFPADHWQTFEAELPVDVGSPITLHFSLEGIDEASLRPPEYGQPTVSWAVPRLVSSKAGETRPRVLFVVFDTLRADRTSLYGYEKATTPFLEELAEKGSVVEEAVAQYPSTQVSHWSIFTGLNPVRHGAYEFLVRPSEGETMAEVFRKSGYLTAAFTDGGYVHSGFGFSRGFDLYDDGPLEGFENLDPLKDTPHRTFDRTEAWLRSNHSREFFLFLHTYHVHVPYTPPPEYVTLFKRKYKGLFEIYYGDLFPFAINNRFETVTPTELKRIETLYLAEIRYLDDAFRDLWQRLEAMGALENTIVVITSDHGEDMMEHDWIHHGTTLYDPALLVPLIFIWPEEVPGGTRLHCQRPLVDVLPTLLDLVGLETPKDIDGRSFAKELKRGQCSESRLAYSELRDSWYKPGPDLPQVSVRDGSWKFILHTKSGKEELYDLTADPGETNDLTASHETERRRMRLLADSYLSESAEETEPVLQTPEMEERLRNLGYIE